MMSSIEFVTGGDLFSREADVLVNPVNCQGVMGRGLALEFKKRFSYNYELYVGACRRGELAPGQVLLNPATVLARALGYRSYIANFPTKDDWRQPSRLEWIEEGLADLVKQVCALPYCGTIAIPPLGCGLGGLEWKEVKPLITEAAGHLTKDGWQVVIYEP